VISYARSTICSVPPRNGTSQDVSGNFTPSHTAALQHSWQRQELPFQASQKPEAPPTPPPPTRRDAQPCEPPAADPRNRHSSQHSSPVQNRPGLATHACAGDGQAQRHVRCTRKIVQGHVSRCSQKQGGMPLSSASRACREPPHGVPSEAAVRAHARPRPRTGPRHDPLDGQGVGAAERDLGLAPARACG